MSRSRGKTEKFEWQRRQAGATMAINMDLTQHKTSPRPNVPCWAAASLLAGASAVAWWVTGINANDGPDHLIGPYRVPLEVEYVAGGVAVLLGFAALLVSIRPDRAQGGMSRASVAVLAVTAIIAAGLWRLVTAGGVGANIGGGMAAFAGPILIAALVFLALCVERSRGGMRTRTFVGLSVMAWGIASALVATAWFGLST